jgi:hypothetical protein
MNKLREQNSEKKDFKSLLLDFIKGKDDGEELLDFPYVDHIRVAPKRYDSTIVFDIEEYPEFFSTDYPDWDLIRCVMKNEICDVFIDNSFDNFSEGEYWLGEYAPSGSDLRNKFIQIYRVVNPDFSINQDYKTTELDNSILLSLAGNIISRYMDIDYEFRNKNGTQNIKEQILEDAEKIFSPYGVTLDLVNDKLRISAGMLYYWLKYFDKGFTDFKEEFISFTKKMDNDRFTGWNEDKYEFDTNEYMQTDEYMGAVSDLIDELYEEVTEFKDPEKRKKVNEIWNKYSKYSNHPITGGSFRIIEYDIAKDVFTIVLRGQGYQNSSIEVKPDDFYTWLQNYTLNFESKNILLSLRKILS